MVRETCETFRFQWPRAPDTVDLGSGEAHVWGIEFDREPASISCLSDSERTRANRFHFEQDRHCFIATRQALRHVLSGYIGIAPEDVQFCLGAWGKPALVAEQQTVHFNVSHTREVGVIAVRKDGEIGVDIEHQTAKVSPMDLAETILSSKELASYIRLEPEVQQQAFFSYWTAKEAYVKALGTGFSIDPRQIEIDLPKTHKALGRCKGPDEGQSPYCLHPLLVEPPVTAAAVTESPLAKIWLFNASSK